MSVWTTRSLERERNYIVLQHTLKGVNYSINGIKFRDGYAVVEKDSKTYFILKRIPVLRASREFPISYLKKLPFITRISDIRTVYGQDVYVKFLENEENDKKLLEKQEEDLREKELQTKLDLQKKMEEAKNSNNEELYKELKDSTPTITKCCYRTKSGTLCKEDAADYSPSGYCATIHLLEDPKLTDFGFEVPKFLTKEEKRDLRERIKTGLKKAKAQGKF